LTYGWVRPLLRAKPSIFYFFIFLALGGSDTPRLVNLGMVQPPPRAKPSPFLLGKIIIYLLKLTLIHNFETNVSIASISSYPHSSKIAVLRSPSLRILLLSLPLPPHAISLLIEFDTDVEVIQETPSRSASYHASRVEQNRVSPPRLSSPPLQLPLVPAVHHHCHCHYFVLCFGGSKTEHGLYLSTSM
jgi:hypothetical protein